MGSEKTGGGAALVVGPARPLWPA